MFIFMFFKQKFLRSKALNFRSLSLAELGASCGVYGQHTLFHEDSSLPVPYPAMPDALIPPPSMDGVFGGCSPRLLSLISPLVGPLPIGSPGRGVGGGPTYGLPCTPPGYPIQRHCIHVSVGSDHFLLDADHIFWGTRIIVIVISVRLV